MATFLIETYLSRERTVDLDDGIARLRAAVEKMATPGHPVRHVRSYYVPDDEMAIHVVEAASLDDASAVVTDAGLASDRIVQAEPATG